MTALIQGFPPDWKFEGKKTAAYRQVGNAFPPPVAHSLGVAIRDAILGSTETQALDLGAAFAPDQADLFPLGEAVGA
jgi:DNA (cytosine-5)-methyltransferase 1